MSSSPTPLAPVRAIRMEDVGPGDPTEDRVLAALSALTGGAPGMVPDDVVLIRTLWADAPDGPTLRRCLDALVGDGRLRRVVVGREPHLVPAALDDRPAALDDREAPDDERRRFALQVAIDVAHERVLFYRFMVVLAGIAAFVVARELALYFLGI